MWSLSVELTFIFILLIAVAILTAVNKKYLMSIVAVILAVGVYFVGDVGSADSAKQMLENLWSKVPRSIKIVNGEKNSSNVRASGSDNFDALTFDGTTDDKSNELLKVNGFKDENVGFGTSLAYQNEIAMSPYESDKNTGLSKWIANEPYNSCYVDKNGNEIAPSADQFDQRRKFADPMNMVQTGQTGLSYDQRLEQMTRARTRDKKTIDGAVSKTADFYAKYYSDELSTTEGRVWWGANEY